MTDSTKLFEFWGALPPAAKIHPKDVPFFDSAKEHHFRTTDRPPAPYDGPLMTAKVVICYANPGYDVRDKADWDDIARQRSGCEELPMVWWKNWYEPRLRAIGLPMEKARKVVAIFNVCPYWSEEMGDREVRLAAGLPSVWAAQKHLREVLIKQALDGEIFLVVARKHQLWGVVEGLDCETLRLVRNRTGSLATIGSEIGDWLSKKHGIRGAT